MGCRIKDEYQMLQTAQKLVFVQLPYEYTQEDTQIIKLHGSTQA